MERERRKATKSCFVEVVENVINNKSTTENDQRHYETNLYSTSPLEFSLDISNHLFCTPLQVFVQDLYFDILFLAEKFISEKVWETFKERWFRLVYSYFGKILETELPRDIQGLGTKFHLENLVILSSSGIVHKGVRKHTQPGKFWGARSGKILHSGRVFNW